MKIKSIIILIVLFTSITVSKAQAYKIGDVTVDGGIGLGYTSIYSGADAWPTLFAGAEKGLYELENIGVISLGGIVAFTHNSYSIVGESYNWTDFAIGARGALHLTSLKIDKVDLYGGLTLGLNFYGHPETTLAHKVDPLAGLFVGGKYYINDKLSAFGELGWDVAWLKLGINYKLF